MGWGMKNQLALMALVCAIASMLSSCSGGDGAAKPVVGRPRQSSGPKCVSGKLQIGDMNGIIGGDIVDKSSWLAHRVVFILDQNEKAACTGLLVDSNIVLTAAHCADSFAGSGLYVLFTAQPECDMENGTIANTASEVERVIVNPQWDKNSKNNFRIRGDLALLRIKGNAPYDWVSTPLTKTYIDPASRSTLVAGYGDTTEYNSGDGIPVMLRATMLEPLSLNVKFQAINVLKKLAADDPTVTPEDFQKIDFMLDPGPDKEMIFFDQSQGRGVCSGDSGGASFSKRGGRIFATGVASFVTNPGHMSQACHLIGAHTSLIFHQQWIEQSFQSLRNFYSTKSTLFE